MINIKSKNRNRAHNMGRMGRCAAVALASGVVGASVALADSQKPFASKTITMLVGTPAGGGPDATARLTAKYLAKYLPGHPNMIVQNMPGGNQVIAASYLKRRAELDGLTLMTGSSSLIDPMVLRNANVQDDPKKLSAESDVAAASYSSGRKLSLAFTIRPWHLS